MPVLGVRRNREFILYSAGPMGHLIGLLQGGRQVLIVQLKSVPSTMCGGFSSLEWVDSLELQS